MQAGSSSALHQKCRSSVLIGLRLFSSGIVDGRSSSTGTPLSLSLPTHASAQAQRKPPRKLQSRPRQSPPQTVVFKSQLHTKASGSWDDLLSSQQLLVESTLAFNKASHMQLNCCCWNCVGLKACIQVSALLVDLQRVYLSGLLRWSVYLWLSCLLCHVQPSFTSISFSASLAILLRAKSLYMQLCPQTKQKAA